MLQAQCLVSGEGAYLAEEARGAGWLEGVSVEVFEGPDEYLYGEETALLEAIDGRPPFPRIAPPYRRGVHEVVDRVTGPEHLTASAAHIELAGPGDTAVGSPTLVNNVETLANVPGIVVEGTVEGNLYALESVALRPGATVRGDIFAVGVAMDEGARLIGRGCTGDGRR